LRNALYLSAIMAGLVLAYPAQATLIGDMVDGDATGLTTFNTGTETVDGTFVPEFAGTLADDNGTTSVSFDFRADTLLIYLESDQSGTTYVPSFSVLFSDLDWLGAPGYILAGVTVNYDEPTEFLGGTPGENITPDVQDHSLELFFTGFDIEEFREIELQLTFAEDTGTGTPIPEPASLVLLLTGLAGLAARRKLT